MTHSQFDVEDFEKQQLKLKTYHAIHEIHYLTFCFLPEKIEVKFYIQKVDLKSFTKIHHLMKMNIFLKKKYQINIYTMIKIMCKYVMSNILINFIEFH